MASGAVSSCGFRIRWRYGSTESGQSNWSRLGGMLTLQRRHSQKCPDRNKGPNYLKCRGHCAMRICGMLNGKRVRRSLKTRDLQRAARRLSEMEEEALGRPRKLLTEAVDAFQAQHAEHAPETRRKYKRVLACLTHYCTPESLRFVDHIKVENL